PCFASERDTIFNANAFNGNKGNHVRCANAGMCSLMRRQIDQFRSFAHAANGCLSHSFPIPNQSDHAAVVIGIHLPIEQKNAGTFIASTMASTTALLRPSEKL